MIRYFEYHSEKFFLVVEIVRRRRERGKDGMFSLVNCLCMHRQVKLFKVVGKRERSAQTRGTPQCLPSPHPN